MNIILKYILDMLPFMLIAIPFYLIGRFLYLKRKKSLNYYHEVVLFIFIIFLVGLVSQTMIPKLEITSSNQLSVVKSRVHKTNLIPFKIIEETYNEIVKYQNINYFIINFLGNIIMFLPIGFFIPLLWKLEDKKVILIGFCSSLLIEITQLFLRRGTDIDDLILNTLGVCLGLLLYRKLYKKWKNPFQKVQIEKEKYTKK